MMDIIDGEMVSMSNDDTDWRAIFPRRSSRTLMPGSSAPPATGKRSPKRSPIKPTARQSIAKVVTNKVDHGGGPSMRTVEMASQTKVRSLARRDHIDLIKIILRNFELDHDGLSDVVREAGIEVTGAELRRTFFTLTRIMTAVDECGIDIRGMRAAD